jgi:hypothetical protein
MAPNSHSYFHYHASAHAFSGRFTRPFDEQIDVQAASSLPVTGGHGCARVENFQFHEFISFKAGYSHVSGGLQTEDESNNTLVTSVLEGLNMMDVLTADRVVCRLYSKHAQGAAEGHVTMHGSKFENLRICGQPVTMNLDFALFEGIPTFKRAQEEYPKKKDFWKIAKDPLQCGKELPPQKDTGAFLCSLVKGNVQLDSPGVQVAGHSIYVPGFGRVFFAEVFMVHGTRNLTMLRFELGSTTGGGGSGGSGTTNGKQYPPGG